MENSKAKKKTNSNARERGNEMNTKSHKITNKLLPCPYCGKEDTPTFTTAQDCDSCSYSDDDCCPAVCFCIRHPDDCKIHFVVCDHTKGGCGASSGWGSDKEVAMRLWNVRNPNITT